MHEKKSLGQHFLTSRSALNAIVDIAEITPLDTVLEIGPGKGVLTEALLKRAGRVIAVEKDDRLIPYLAERFADEIASGKLSLIHDDALVFDPVTYHLKPNTYKLVANIPYYITGALLERFLSTTSQPSRMVLLVQKEVAERIIAKDGKESILSISIQAYGVPRYVKTVKARAFNPPPKVDSAILLIEHISRDFFSDMEETTFFRIVHAGFAHKRKRLATNLKVLAPESVLGGARIPPNSRAEELSIGQWKILTQKISALVSPSRNT